MALVSQVTHQQESFVSSRIYQAYLNELGLFGYVISHWTRCI